jgi:hypothetical protein
MPWQNISIALFCAAMAMILFGRGAVQMLMESIENISGNFRGGPPTPMHPLPSDDRRLLLRHTRKSRDHKPDLT